MKITFLLKFHTHFGQKIFITGDNKFFGDNKVSDAIELYYFNEEFWKVDIKLPAVFKGMIRYRYILQDSDGLNIFDAEQNRFIDVPARNKRDISVIDTWNDGSNEGNVFFTSAFCKVLRPSLDKGKLPSSSQYNFEFRVKAPFIQSDETICMSGSSSHLGSWDSENPIILFKEKNWFVGRVLLDDNEWPANYKYGIYNLTSQKMVGYEEGENRTLYRNENHKGLTIYGDEFINFKEI